MHVYIYINKIFTDLPVRNISLENAWISVGTLIGKNIREKIRTVQYRY